MNFYYSSNPKIQKAYENHNLYLAVRQAVLDMVDKNNLYGTEAYSLLDYLESKADEFKYERAQLEMEERDADLLRWYQQAPNDIMFTMNPANLARVKELMRGLNDQRL